MFLLLIVSPLRNGGAWLCLCAFMAHRVSLFKKKEAWNCSRWQYIYTRVVCLCVFVNCSYIPVFHVMPSSECGANLSKTLPKSGIQIGKSDQRHTSAVAKINIQPFFAFTQTLSLNSFIFLTKEGDFQEPIKVFLSVLVCSLARYPCIDHCFFWNVLTIFFQSRCYQFPLFRSLL